MVQMTNEELITILDKTLTKESNNLPLFKENFSPILLDGNNLINDNQKNEIIYRYLNAGYAVFELEDLNKGIDNIILSLSKQLNLGEPYIPVQYQNSTIYKENKLNEVVSGNVSNHKAFLGKNEQKLHSDGTLTPIGYLPTTILFCLFEAEEGGETILFNSTGAFLELAANDPNSAISLLDEKSLRRITDFGIIDSFVGPAFKIKKEEVISRFTLDNTADWKYGIDNVPNLEKALNFLKESATPPSEFYKKFTLKKGQGIIFANDKIAHGRTSFINSEANNRKMIRGLYCNRVTTQ